MFPRSSFSSAVSDIQSLLGDADPATAGLDDATRAWLLDTRQAIIAQRRGTGGRPSSGFPGMRRTFRPSCGAAASTSSTPVRE